MPRLPRRRDRRRMLQLLETLGTNHETVREDCDFLSRYFDAFCVCGRIRE